MAAHALPATTSVAGCRPPARPFTHGGRRMPVRCAAAAGEPSCEGPGRRALVLAGAAFALWRPADASANIFQDYVERSQRPEITPQQAIIQLLDARGTLYELRDLAQTAPNSDERFRARALLPGMAKRLREAGQAAPAVLARVAGGNVKSTLSEEYGGKGGDDASAVPIYIAIGQVITISGRTIRKEAQASPEFASRAIEKIDALLALLPQADVDAAQASRRARARA